MKDGTSSERNVKKLPTHAYKIKGILIIQAQLGQIFAMYVDNPETEKKALDRKNKRSKQSYLIIVISHYHSEFCTFMSMLLLFFSIMHTFI